MFEFRRASLKDIDELIRLRIEFMKEAMNIAHDDQDYEIRESLREYFNSTMKEDRFVAWLAITDCKIVATSGICFYTFPPSYKNMKGSVAYIMNMYTIPDYRNRGAATNLFKKVVNEAKVRDIKKLKLNATEQGRPIYRKFGFQDEINEMVLNL